MGVLSSGGVQSNNKHNTNPRESATICNVQKWLLVLAPILTGYTSTATVPSEGGAVLTLLLIQSRILTELSALS